MAETSPVLIPVKDRQQAMDWSLALTSQEIEVAIIETDEGKLALQIPAPDSVRAFQTLKLYHAENRRWDWWLAQSDSGPRFEPRVLFWLMALAFWHAIATRTYGVAEAGVMDSGRFANGEFWRLFTAITLHNDLGHLATNITIGLLLFGLAGARYGLGWSLLATYLAGVLGNIVGWLVYDPPYRSLGVSGMVLGALGMLIARPLMGVNLPVFQRKRLLVALSVGVMLFLLLASSPNSDVAAHVGGFAGGIIFGWCLRRMPTTLKSRSQNAALIIFAALVVGTWAMAFLL